MSGASRALGTALDDKVWLEQATVVVPSHWRDSKCGLTLRSPKGNTRHRVIERSPYRINWIEHTEWNICPFFNEQSGEMIALLIRLNENENFYAFPNLLKSYPATCYAILSSQFDLFSLYQLTLFHTIVFFCLSSHRKSFYHDFGRMYTYKC